MVIFALNTLNVYLIRLGKACQELPLCRFADSELADPDPLFHLWRVLGVFRIWMFVR